MGVPITVLDKYNPEQLEIVKFRKGDDEKDLTYTTGTTGPKSHASIGSLKHGEFVCIRK